MLSLTRSCCRTVHLMPNCFGSVAQAHRDHWEVLEIVVATLIGVRHRPLGVRHRPLVHLRYVEVGDLDSLGQVSKKLALMELVSRMDFDLFPSSSLWMILGVSMGAACDCSSGFVCVLVVMEV